MKFVVLRDGMRVKFGIVTKSRDGDRAGVIVMAGGFTTTSEF